jgi:hypothetical protein
MSLFVFPYLVNSVILETGATSESGTADINKNQVDTIQVETNYKPCGNTIG